MSGLEIPAAAVGFAAFAIAFKGAVDSFMFIEDLFSNDDQGLSDLSLQYLLESKRLEAWGVSNNIRAPEEGDSNLSSLNTDTRDQILNVLARLKELNQKAEELSRLHDRDGPLLSVNETDGAPSRNEFSSMLKKCENRMAKQKEKLLEAKRLKRKFNFIVKNKTKFIELVKNLKYYNDYLDRLTMVPMISMGTMLRAIALAPLIEASLLQRIEKLPEWQGSNVAQAAVVKAIEISSQTNKVTYLQSNDLAYNNQTVESQEASGARVIATYKQTKQVWIEWRVAKNGLDGAQTTSFWRSTEILSAKLVSAFARQLNLADCIGIIRDRYNGHRMGLVCTASATLPPKTLIHLIGKLDEPPLGEKFRLAQYFAASLAGLHAAGWIHRAFRSDNMLCFGEDLAALKTPMVSGFESARQVGAESIANRPNGGNQMDYYYHPLVHDGFSKGMDLYSLGVLLLEIAYWKPLYKMLRKQKANSLERYKVLFIQSARESLPAMVGSIYTEVVLCCLECRVSGEDDIKFASDVNSEIIYRLNLCRA
ncbi:hypothetical protein F4814DRAFT_413067 [Daldinia grandis]|nr:hypothetical protein F4814DRAFT_413067 [Daldinia grandis]